jgi:glutamate synthase (NADPH/NADH)
MGLLEDIDNNNTTQKVQVDEQEPQSYTEYKSDTGYGWADALPQRQGLYNPELEKDACGVGFTA